MPSSSEDFTCATRGLPKRFSRNYLREMAANLVKRRLYVLIFKRCFVAAWRDVFCTLSCLFVRLGLRLLCALWLFIILPFHPVGFKQTSTATTNEYNGCVSEGYNSVHFIAVLYKTTFNDHILHIRENVNDNGQFLEFLLEF